MRHCRLFASLILGGAILSPAAFAATFTLSNGNVGFTVPSGWPRIVHSRGNPQTMVFQVPDPSPTAQEALARVAVTSQHVRDVVSFEAYVAATQARDRELPHYKLDAGRSTTTTFYFTANDGSVAQQYVEHFSLHNGFAVEVRCVRPVDSQAGADWTATFDRNCKQVTASLHAAPPKPGSESHFDQQP